MTKLSSGLVDDVAKPRRMAPEQFPARSRPVRGGLIVKQDIRTQRRRLGGAQPKGRLAIGSTPWKAARGAERELHLTLLAKGEAYRRT